MQYARYQLDLYNQLIGQRGFQQVINDQFFNDDDIMTKLTPDDPPALDSAIDKLSSALPEIFAGIASFMIGKILPGGADIAKAIVAKVVPDDLLDKDKSDILQEWNKSEKKDHQAFRDITKKLIGNLTNQSIDALGKHYSALICSGDIFQKELEAALQNGVKKYQDPSPDTIQPLVNRYIAQWRLTAALVFMSQYYYLGTTGNMDFCYCSYIALDTFPLIYHGPLCLNNDYRCPYYKMAEDHVIDRSTAYKPNQVKCFTPTETNDCHTKTNQRYLDHVKSKNETEAWLYMDSVYGWIYGHMTESVQGFFLKRSNNGCPKSNQAPNYGLDMHSVMAGEQYKYYKALVDNFKNTYDAIEESQFYSDYYNIIYPNNRELFEKIKINAMSYFFGEGEDKDNWKFYVAACEPKKYCDTDRIGDDAFACAVAWFFETKSYALCESNCTNKPPGGWFNL